MRYIRYRKGVSDLRHLRHPSPLLMKPVRRRARLLGPLTPFGSRFLATPLQGTTAPRHPRAPVHLEVFIPARPSSFAND